MTGGQRYVRGRAYRDGSLICGRVHVTLDRVDRIGSVPGERRTVIARFEDRMHPTLRAELDELVRCQGAAVRRAAERIAPIVLLLGDPRNGQQRIVGRLLPPQQRRNDLHEIEFRLRELPP
jgi:hypothetical protein